MPNSDKKKHRLWQFDPSTFTPLRKSGFLDRRIWPVLRSAGKSLLFGLGFAYPFLLVTSGILYGGIVFWSLLAGSFAIIGLVITKTGYAKNFAHWDLNLKKFAALFLTFLVTLGFYEGLINFRLWVIPIFAAVLILALALFLYRERI